MQNFHGWHAEKIGGVLTKRSTT